MPVLLISRGTMSGGELVARCLSHTARLRTVTREDLIASVNQHGELASRVTAELDRATQNYERFSELRRPYRIFMRHALLEYARDDNLAYLGYSGHMLVEGTSHFLKVRLIAPTELRIRMTMGRLRCGEVEAADYIRKADDERVRWARFMYGKNLRDPELYDLCISMERMSIPTVCSILAGALNEAELRATPESLADLEDQYLASRVLVALLSDPETFPLEIGATVREGRVLLEGPYVEPRLLEKIVAGAESVSGGVEARYEPGYAPFIA